MVNGKNLKGKEGNERSQEYQDPLFEVEVQLEGPKNEGVIHTGNGCPVHGNPEEGVVLEVVPEVVDYGRDDYQ